MSDDQKHSTLQEQLHLAACKKAAGEPVVSVVTSQPFFGLSRAQVQELLQMLASAESALRLLCSPPGQEIEENHNEVGEDFDEAAIEAIMTTLHTKVRLIPCSRLKEPLVAILRLESFACELRQEELDALEGEVIGLISDLRVQEDPWFYAYEQRTSTYHLMCNPGWIDRYGPVLCGCRPPAQAGKIIFWGWSLLFLQGKQPDGPNVCVTCLERWKRQHDGQ